MGGTTEMGGANDEVGGATIGESVKSMHISLGNMWAGISSNPSHSSSFISCTGDVLRVGGVSDE